MMRFHFPNPRLSATPRPGLFARTERTITRPSRPPLNIGIALIALLLSACSDPQIALIHSPATTSVAGDIRLSDAKPLDDLQSDDVQVTMTNKLDPPDAGRTVYFGEADQFDSDDPDTPVAALPLIAVRDGGWRGVPLAGAGLENTGWKYVAAGPALNEIWGVLDTTAGDSGPEFVVAHSTNGAASFTLKVFKKPCRLATFADFAMSRNGHGRVTLSLDVDWGSFKAGLYHYDTIDDGKTWSGVPRYEPDAMIQADTVPDGEQPDHVQGPMRTLLKSHPR